MKKLKVLSVLASIAMLASVFVGCSNGSGDSNSTATKEFEKDDLELDSSSIISGYAYITYPLDDFAGKKVTIDFSCEMKVENAGSQNSNIQWQINDGSTYPTVASKSFAPTDTEYVTVSGKSDPIDIKSGYVLYLSTYQLDTDNLKIYVKNIKYSVSYGSDGNEPAAKTYPTDIFTVGEAGSCGITLRDTKEPFTIFTEGSAVPSVKHRIS